MLEGDPTVAAVLLAALEPEIWANGQLMPVGNYGVEMRLVFVYLYEEPGQQTCNHHPRRRLLGFRSVRNVNTILDRPNRPTCLRKRVCLRISWAAGSAGRCLHEWVDEEVDRRDVGRVVECSSPLAMLLTAAVWVFLE